MNNNSLSINSIVVGMDIHKYSHTAVAMDILGKEIGYLKFDNEKLDICLSWLKGLGSKRNLIIGLENVNGYGFHLARKLNKKGFNLHYISPILTDRARKHTIHREKTDYIDAKQVGKVILNKFEELLPASPVISEEQKNLRLIDIHLQERESLVKQKRKIKNHLHNLLHQYYGDNYKNSFNNIFSKKSLKYYKEDIKETKNDLNFLSNAILRLIKHLNITKDHIKEIDKILNDLGNSIKYILILKDKLFGCNLINACKIMVEIKTIDRFINQDKLARYGGFAPVKKMSGNSGKLYTDRYGNRKLNMVVYSVALTQISRYGPEKSKSYYKKKISEGKSKLWALRCLKRQIIKNIFNILKEVN